MLPLLLALAPPAPAQPTPTAHAAQGWLGLMTQTRLSDPLSLWNDVHLVPGAFTVLRTGLTGHLPHRLALTGGYAYVALPLADRGLRRPEHRPWAQLVQVQPFGDRWRLTSRLRLDARFRRNVAGDTLLPGYTPIGRVRGMVTARRDLPALSLGAFTPYVSLADELLVNVGPEVERNRIDQNRASLAVGLARGLDAAQVGYMNRAVVAPSGAVTVNHTLVVWLFANPDLRRPRDPS